MVYQEKLGHDHKYTFEKKVLMARKKSRFREKYVKKASSTE